MDWSIDGKQEVKDVKQFVRRNSVMASRKSIKQNEPSKILEDVLVEVPEAEFNQVSRELQESEQIMMRLKNEVEEYPKALDGVMKFNAQFETRISKIFHQNEKQKMAPLGQKLVLAHHMAKEYEEALTEEIGGLTSMFKEWFIGFNNCKTKFKERQKAIKDYMHYHMKIPKLKQDLQMKETMGQTVKSVKEGIRVKRNQKKLQDCENKLKKSHNECYAMMKEIIGNRFTLINPAVARFLGALRRYYSGCASIFEKFVDKTYHPNEFDAPPREHEPQKKGEELKKRDDQKKRKMSKARFDFPPTLAESPKQKQKISVSHDPPMGMPMSSPAEQAVPFGTVLQTEASQGSHGDEKELKPEKRSLSPGKKNRKNTGGLEVVKEEGRESNREMEIVFKDESSSSQHALPAHFRQFKDAAMPSYDQYDKGDPGCYEGGEHGFVMSSDSPYSPTTAPYSPDREREEEKFEAIARANYEAQEEQYGKRNQEDNFEAGMNYASVDLNKTWNYIPAEQKEERNDTEESVDEDEESEEEETQKQEQNGGGFNFLEAALPEMEFKKRQSLQQSLQLNLQLQAENRRISLQPEMVQRFGSARNMRET